MKKIVLAYSGGLDTSVIMRWLIEKYRCEVVAFVADLGQGEALAHGATGKGNDQVRFELTARALAPDLKIVAPWREWEFTSRPQLIDYAEKHGIPLPVSKEKPYSTDANLMHVSYEGGILEDPWAEPPSDMFRMTKNAEDAPSKPRV